MGVLLFVYKDAIENSDAFRDEEIVLGDTYLLESAKLRIKVFALCFKYEIVIENRSHCGVYVFYSDCSEYDIKKNLNDFWSFKIFRIVGRPRMLLTEVSKTLNSKDINFYKT